jgi:ABC-2 type transport system permease protein
MKSRFIKGAVDEFRHIKRDPLIALIMIAISLIYPFLLSALYQQNKVTSRPFALIDLDNSALSREIVSSLAATQGLSLTVRLNDKEQAKRMLIHRDVDMVVIIPQNLSANIKQGRQGVLHVWSYTANILTYSTGYAALSETILHINSRLALRTVLTLGAGKNSAEASAAPVHPDMHYLFHPTLSYGEFLIPGIFIIVFQQVLLIGLVYSAGIRREKEGIKAIPPSLREFYGRAAAQLPFYSFTALTLLIFFNAYSWPILTTFAGSALFILFMFAVLPLGMLVATFVSNQYSAFNNLMFLSAPLLMISGFAMPLFAMPVYLQWIARIFPTTPALAIMRMISNKSTELTYIVPSIIHLLVLTVLFMSLLKLRLWFLNRYKTANVKES